MENPKFSEDTRDKYIDATVAVFMDQYAAALDEGILEEMAACADDAFPPELDKRCLVLIEKEYAKQRKAVRTKSFLRVCRSAAVIAIILLSLCSVLFMTVEAFRLPVLNFFIEKTDIYWESTGHNTDEIISTTFNEENPLKDILPADYKLIMINGSFDDSQYLALYEKSETTQVFFTANANDGYIQVDTEDAETQQFLISGREAYISTEDTSIRIVWFDPHLGKAFSVCATNSDESFVLTLAEEIIKHLA